MSARAALDAARAVFAISRREPSDSVSVPMTSMGDDADLSSPGARAAALWHGAASVLQAAIVRSDLDGQALIGEARRLNQLSLTDAHTLVALHGWRDQQQKVIDAKSAAPASDEEQKLANDAWLALERLVANSAHAEAASAPNNAWSPPPLASPAAPPTPKARTAPPAASPARESAPARHIGRVPVLLSLLLVIVAAAGFWFWNRSRDSRDLVDGVAAFERGATETAKQAFARAAQANPDDARPLVYLGRIAREQRDFAASRNFLDAAVRADPQSAVARREYGSTLLAEGRAEIARRFYVRALELNPGDTLAQGYLACALHRLGRDAEATRWSQRAGPGPWTPCLNTPAPDPSQSATPPQ